MMGLLDWLSDAIGGGDASGFGSGDVGAQPTQGLYNPGGPPPPPVTPPAPPQPAPTQPMPPVQPADDTGGSAPVQPLDMTSGPGTSSTGPNPAGPTPPGLPGGVPLPAPRPPGAGPSASALPAGAAPTSGTTPPGLPVPGAPPGAPMDITSAAQQQQSVPGQTWLGRALGIIPDQGSKIMKEFGGGLGAGLKSVGQNWNKPGAAAFAAGAGAAIEGSQNTAQKNYDNKIKALQQSVAAQTAGDKKVYNEKMAEYLTAKVKNETDKAASSGGGKSGAWNKPEYQRFLDAQRAVASDPDVDGAKKILAGAIKSGEPADIQAAQTKLSQLVQQKQAQYYATVGLSPQTIANMSKNPPGTAQNPVQVKTQEDFDAYVKPGQAYVNPRDGKVYIRNSADKKGADSPAAEGAPAAPSAPAAPGPAPGTKASDDDEED